MKTCKRHGCVRWWLGAQWAASRSSLIQSSGIGVSRYSLMARRVRIAVKVSNRGRSSASTDSLLVKLVMLSSLLDSNYSGDSGDLKRSPLSRRHHVQWQDELVLDI